MGAQNFLHNREAEARAFLVFAAGQVSFVETVENQLLVFFGNADAGIFYGDKDLVVALGRFDPDRRIRM